VRLEWVDPAVCSLDYRLKIIGRLPFFKHLSADTIAQINNLFHDFDVSAEARVCFEGDEAQYLYLIAIGKVKLVRSTETGKEILLDILHSGDYFGSLYPSGGSRYRETAIAQTDCCILRISTADFDRVLTDHPDVTRKVLQAVNQRLAESQEIVKQLSSFTAEQRIASALMRLASKLGEARGSGVLIQLPFSRQDLAAMTGSTVETVSRVMSRFGEDGLVKSGRKWVTITDPKRLEELIKRGTVN
jgi:CRP-like cAMP-binding protein